MTYRWVHIFLTLALLAGCDRSSVPISPGGSAAVSEDSNDNGIRDNIDALISLKYSASDDEQNAAEQLALSMQALLDENLSVIVEGRIQVLLDDGAKASNCVHQVFGLQRMAELSRALEILTYNTDERLTKYMSFMQKTHGMTEWAPFVLSDGTVSDSCAS